MSHVTLPQFNALHELGLFTAAEEVEYYIYVDFVKINEAKQMEKNRNMSKT